MSIGCQYRRKEEKWIAPPRNYPVEVKIVYQTARFLPGVLDLQGFAGLTMQVCNTSITGSIPVVASFRELQTVVPFFCEKVRKIQKEYKPLWYTVYK
ncbi:MAG: hypothetical protein LUE92_05285 [Clostridiales bacterium]|nr:hypothetical protein [Clostridiales bacterium]